MKNALAIFLTLASFSTLADVHRWVDANGKVHYSDEAPSEDVNSKTIRTKHSDSTPEPAASGTPPAKTIYEQAADINKANKEKEEAAKKAAQKEEEAKIKQKNCEQSRSQLLSLQNSPRIATYNESGERVIMDDGARQQSIKDAQDAVSKYCN